MPYSISHPTIRFSSNSEDKVKYIEDVLASLTLEDIKENKLEGRHQLLLQMAFGGDSDIVTEYFETKERKCKLYEDKISRLNRKTSRYFFQCTKAAEECKKEVYELTGWVL